MKFPYWLQGALFAPALLGLLFLLKVTCPAPTGAGCFADNFILPAFLPLIFVYRAFGQASFIFQYDTFFMFLYWITVGLLVGLCFDVCRNRQEE